MINVEARDDKNSAIAIVEQDEPNDDRKEEVNTKYVEESAKEYCLENVLSDLKLSGRYHVRFILWLCLCLFISVGFSINYIFTVEDITYRCKYLKCSDNEILQLEKNSTLNFKCRKYEVFDDNGTCKEENFDSSRFSSCFEFIYDKPNSFVAEFNIGCEDWKRTLVGTIHSFGYMIGLLVFGPLSDKFGRKNIIILNTLVGASLGISKSFVPSYWLFIMLEFSEAILGDNYSAMYTMAVEMVTTNDRPVVILVFSVVITVGDIIMTFMAYMTTSWRTFLILLYTPAFLVFIHIFGLDESLRWLLIKGKKAEAEVIIRKAMKMNNIVIDEAKLANLKIEEKSTISLKESLKVTFSSRKLFIRLILCICIWFTGLFNAYALTINSVSLEGNKYINFIFICLCSSVAGVILLYVLKKFQRKSPLIIALILTGLFCVSQSFVPKGYKWLSTLLYMCGKINSTVTIRMAYLYTAELFPTYTRNTMLALCSSVGRIGAMLAPLTPLLLVYWSSFPSFLVGVLSLVTALVVTLMPDTAEDVLPDNVKQAETIGCVVKIKKDCKIMNEM